jgi:beta-xylosidase
MTGSTAQPDPLVEPWRDPRVSIADRVADLVSRMTLAEKVAQLTSVWGIDPDVGDMAPMLRDAMGPGGQRWDEVIAHGLGQLTRPFGTEPIEPAEGMRALAERQRQVVAASRFGIPAQVHEECLTGLNAWRATVYPAPLSWAASFDPALVERMGGQIGADLRRLGVHQGLAPVLDVVRDLRWGRVEETLGEDPFLVGLMGSAYVCGLESSGVVATLKHFAGYSASRAGRNHAPVAIGPRELADVILPPFEMALRAGARSVMNSYTDTDGVPAAADPALLTTLLRDTLGFTGTVVADYFSIAFLRTLHHVAESTRDAGRLALTAGIDVELPSANAYAEPLVAAVTDGVVDEKLVDRAVTRVLRQKCELGLLDPDWAPVEPADVHLDTPESRALALDLARRAVVLLANDGTLPLRPAARLAVVGPRADTSEAMLGCYSFPMHVLVHYPDLDPGLEIRTVRSVLEDTHMVDFEPGCPVVGGTDEDIAAAAAVAAEGDVCVAVLGDQAGLFGNGTSGEGCDVADLRLPGRQEELLEALLATGTPVVAVLLIGRPYDLSRQVSRLAGVVCGFFPGEEGAQAIADVLTGQVNPSGRLPVGFPGAGSTQPSTYLASALGQRNEVTVVDPTQLFPFGHGLSYAPVTWGDVTSVTGPLWQVDGECEVAVDLSNETERASSEVVQIYLHDPTASVVRPVQQLIGAARVDLEAGECRRVRFAMHADLTSFTGRDLIRVVEPGTVELRIGASSADIRAVLPFELVGTCRTVGAERTLAPRVTVEPAPDA